MDTNSTAAANAAVGEGSAAVDGSAVSDGDVDASGSRPAAKADDAAPKPRDPSPLGLARETYNFHLAALLLLWCLAMLNMPALVVWFKQVG